MKNRESTMTLAGPETERFGIVSARAYCANSADLPSIMSFSEERRVKFLIARCSVDDLGVAQEMERQGFRIMDTLIYYIRKISDESVPLKIEPVAIRSFRSGEEEQIRDVAVLAFTGYQSHYHADPRLDRAKCDAAYSSWAYNSCLSRDVADDVLVATDNERLIAMATLRKRDDGMGEGVLFGVHPSAQGKGIYRALIIKSMDWCKEQGLPILTVSTQVTNLAVQKVWIRLGFEPNHAFYTFHKWFD